MEGFRVLGIRQGVAACLDHVPALAPFPGVTFAGQRVEKVYVEVMPWRFERVGVFSSVCRDGPFVRSSIRRRPKRRAFPQARGSMPPSAGRDEGQSPKNRGRAKASPPPQIDQTEREEGTRSWFSRTKLRPSSTGMAVQLLGVKQCFTSSFKFSFRRRLRWRCSSKANMLSREERKMNGGDRAVLVGRKSDRTSNTGRQWLPRKWCLPG